MKQTRNTQQKRLILDLLKNNRTHPTADEVYEKARQLDSRISRGTVYRNLKAFDDEGILRRLAMPYGPDHYDIRTDNHYHFICRCCNRVVDTELPYKSELNAVPRELADYQVEWHRLILVGVCPECIQKTNEREE